MKISIITPFYGASTPALLPDYRAAVAGAEVIAVDNASPPEAAVALAEAATADGWLRIRNAANAGFAGANNQGYAAATGDIIVFCNSDIAAPPAFLAGVAADVRDGALYGPSLQAQLVAGRWLPYLEGWCIAATRATWARLVAAPAAPYYAPDGMQAPQAPCGPWDADAFPGPYWEDNDLCFRAAVAGAGLVQTVWPIQHKGGQSAGALAQWGISFEANRATFARRVLAAFAGASAPTPTPMQQRLARELATDSDIRHHLPLLRAVARGNVVELGTRTGVSTCALLAGVEARGGKVLSIDTDDCSAVAHGHAQWAFLQASSTDPRALGCAEDTGWLPIDVLLIDTLHTVDQAWEELTLWEPRVAPGGMILMHDPETFPGVRRAIQDYTATRPDLYVTYVLPNNGMAVITKATP